MNSIVSLVAFASLLAGSVVAASAAIERVVEKTFPVTGAGMFELETQGGSVRVEPATDSVITVTARQKIRARSDQEADELLERLELTMEQNGNDVRVVSKYSRQGVQFWRGGSTPVRVDFVIRMPTSFDADIRTSGGNISIAKLDGQVNARTSGGSVKLGQMGGTVDVHTSGGNITLEHARGAVTLHTSGGDILVGEVAGRADISTSGGDIRIRSAENAISAHTSGGNIEATIAGPLQDACSLRTSGGDVRVAVAKTAAFRLDASTGGGGVSIEGLTLSEEIANRRRTRFTGLANGGGPLLTLRTSGGDVEVRAE